MKKQLKNLSISLGIISVIGIFVAGLTVSAFQTGFIDGEAYTTGVYFQNPSGEFNKFIASSSIPTDITWVLPNTDGSTGQVIATDGSGNLSWATPGTPSLTLGNMFVGNSSNAAVATSTIFIASTMNVGIGTTVPAFKLDVNGDIQAINFRGSSLPTSLNNINGATNTLERLIDAAGQSSGTFKKAYITDNGDGTVFVAAGQGMMKDANDHDQTLNFMSWAASSSIAIETTAVTYIGVSYNAGNPIVVKKTADSWNTHTEFRLGLAVKENGTTHLFNNPQFIANAIGHSYERFYETEPFEYASRLGGGIVGDTGTNQLTVTSAEFYDGYNEIDCSAVDTSSGDYFTTYYQDGVGGFTFATTTAWDNLQYDDTSGTLATLTTNRYGNHWIYWDMEEPCGLMLVYGMSNSVSQAGAEAASSPSSLPLRITSHGKLIARLTFKESASASASIGSTLLTTISATAQNDHNLLSNLQGGTTGEYYHTTEAENTALVNTSGVNTGDVTLAGQDYLTLSSQQITAGTINNDDGGTGQDSSGWTGVPVVAGGTWSASSTLGSNVITDSYLLNTGDIGTGVYDFGGATSLEIPNGAAPTVNASGEIALDTTSDQTVVYGSAKRVIDEDGKKPICFTATSSSVIVSGERFMVGALPFGITMFNQSAAVIGGTSVVLNFSDEGGTNDTTSITASTTRGTTATASNNTWNEGEGIEIETGTVTGSVTQFNICGWYRITAN